MHGQFEPYEPEAINENLDFNPLMRSIRALMSSSVKGVNLPEMSGSYERMRNLHKKSKGRQRLLFTRMGRAAGADVDTPPALVQYLRKY